MDELRWIDGELARLDQSRAWLIQRRMALLAELASQPQPSPEPEHGPEPARARPELTGRTVARVLLAAGAVLSVIAAAAFTVANWSSIGTFGRSVVLVAVSVVVLVAPRPLVRRGLAATAEAIAAVGLALTIADVYLAGRMIGHGSGTGLLQVAAGTAILALAWVCYGAAVRLRGPWLAAIGMGQLPGLLLATALVHERGLPLALCVTAGADLLLAHVARRMAYRAEAVACLVAAVMVWVIGVSEASAQVALVARPVAAGWLAAAFTAAALTGILAWPRSVVPAFTIGPVAVTSGFVLTAIALPVTVTLPGQWPYVAFAVAASAVAAGALALRHKATELVQAGVRLDLAAAGAYVMLGVTALAVLPGIGSGWPALIVLTLVSGACWLAPVTQRTGAKCTSIAVGTLAYASVPATSLVRLAILTIGAAALAGWSATRTREAGRALAGTTVICAVALGAVAALLSLTGRYSSVAELGGLTAIFLLPAVIARNDITKAVSAGAALAAMTGLAFIVQGAFAAVGVATIALAAATLLRRTRPGQALVLDLGAGSIVVIAAVVAATDTTAGHVDGFAVVTVAGAMLASATSWLRSGLRRSVALGATGCAVLAALVAQWRPLSQPWSVANLPWHGHPVIGSGPSAGLPFAVGVLVACLLALVAAAGSLRGSAQGSLDAVAIALPVVAGPALLAGTLGYWVVLSCLVVLAVALTVWVALRGSFAPAGGAVVATSLALAWGLAAEQSTLIVLGCLAATYLACAWRAKRANVMVCLGVLALEAAWCAWLIGLGVGAIEPYTIPPALVLVAVGWHVTRRPSWLTLGPGLMLLLLPSLIASWHEHGGWIRPAALGITAVSVALIGAARRLKAPVELGVVVAAIDAGHQLAPAVRRVAELVPGWVPIALCGAVLIWVGATYEARIRNLARIRRALADLS